MADDFEGIVFAAEDEPKPEARAEGLWKLLVVDDEEEVHHVTHMVLADYRFEGRGVDFIGARSGAEAKELMGRHPDAAVVLLDVVMETDHAGLEVARYIREELKNRFVRIILRTGHPGQAPERKVILEFDINDYKQKSELTSQKLFTAVTSALRSYRDLHEIEQNRQRLEKILAALNVAQEVQQSLLPQNPPRAGGVDVAGGSLYCDETGGDYYDYIDLPESESGRLAVVVGDVSGHGISSALLMAGVRSYLRGRVRRSGSAAEVVTDVNVLVADDTRETGQFMTMFFLAVDPETGRITWVRAGHDPALFYNPEADVFHELGGTGLALGLDGDWRYEGYTRTAATGQVLALATDGIWEARNIEGEVFGKDRFKAVIREYAGETAEGIRLAAIGAVHDWRGDRPQEDDITLVLIKF